MFRFILCMVLTVIFWPVSQLLILFFLCLFFWMGDGHSGPDSNPFNGPKQTYYWFKQKYDNLFGGISKFIKQEVDDS